VKHWRLVLVLLLLGLPMALFLGVGVAAFWQSGRMQWLWWMLPVCWGLAYLLARRWRPQLVTLPAPEIHQPRHWTLRDEAAWQLVQQQQQHVTQLPPKHLADPHFYLQSAMDLALDISRHYHPKSRRDPVGSLTVSEIMAAAQLAIEDSAAWVQDYVPGSQLLTVDHWRMLAKAPGWVKTVSNASWAVSILVNPLNVGRFLASKLTVDATSKQIQENVLAWFYAVFMRHTGFYLIEMNSGRLRGGAARYRELQRQLQDRPLVAAPQPNARSDQGEPEQPCDVTIVLLGQANAGKSSLVNAILTDRQAPVDVLPTTKGVVRYRLDLEGAADRLIMLDTVGHGNEGASPRELEEVTRAAQQADLIVMVASATNPAKSCDVDLLNDIRCRVESSTKSKLPPVVVALTHVDRLSPVLEWAPPYNWQQPGSPKEQSIAGAVEYAEQVFEGHAAATVPISTRGNHVYGVHEELIPAIVALLGEARACSLLRALHSDVETGQIARLFQQLVNVGTGLLKASLTSHSPSQDGIQSRAGLEKSS